MKLEQSFLTKNECYISGKQIQPTGIVIHSVGCAQPDRSVFVKSWNVPRPNGSQVCVHGFIDDKGITQTLPWNMRCWGCGSGKNGSYNNTHIQVELCEPAGSKYSGGQFTSYDVSKNEAFFRATVENAIQLCVYLVKQFNIKVNNIVCHAEAYRQGYASNHSDVEHWFKKHNYTMDQFRAEVNKRINNDDSSNDTNLDDNKTKEDDDSIIGVKVGDIIKLKPNAKQFDGNSIRSDYIDKEYKVQSINPETGRVVLTINGVIIYAVNIVNIAESRQETPSTPSGSFTVKVSISNLNIRGGPSTGYTSLGYCPPGVYTIVEVINGFGRLKSGAGWISMAYVTKL